MEQIKLHFFGPYSFFKGDKSLFHSQYAKSEGIYLWVIKHKEKNLNYIHYIGETTNFAWRQTDHIIYILGLDYRIIDADSAVHGVEKIIWDGMWRDKTADAVGNTLEHYDSVSKKVLKYIKIIDVYFAPTELPRKKRKHIEGCIASNLRHNHPDVKMFYPDDNRTGKSTMLGIKLVISADEEILGLDKEIML